MSEVSLFIAAVVVVLLVGVVAHLVARLTVSSSTRVAAFAFVCGFAVARFSGNGPTFENATTVLASVAGAALGLGLLYWWWFKRGQSVKIDG